MKTKIIIMIAILLMSLSIASGYETKNISVENHTFEITPIIENLCEDTNNVFRIERNPYYSSMEGILVKYVFVLRGESGFVESEHEKTIKKYSEANTGIYETPSDGNYTIIFAREEVNLSWRVNVDCETNISLNNTNESLENETNTTVVDDNSTINDTGSGEEKVNSSKNCEFEMYTNKNLFKVSEKVKIHFLTDADEYKITYLIKDLDGKVVKSEYTSENTNTKSYTFKSIDEKEKGYYVIARIESECINKEEKELVIVKAESKEDKSKIEITKAEFEGEYVELEIEAYRGNTSKRTINIYVEDVEEGKKISKTTSITLPEKNSFVSAKINLQINEDIPFAGTIIATGLGEKDQKTIKLFEPKAPEIIRSYTRSKYLSENITWYVRLKGEGEITVNFTSNTKNEVKEIVIDGEKTIEFILENPLSEENISIVAEQFGLKASHVSSVKLIDRTKEEKVEKIIPQDNVTKKVNKTIVEKNIITGKTISGKSSKRQREFLPWLIGAIIITTGGFLAARNLKKKGQVASFIKSEDDMISDETKRNQ